jgi:hypothetical protein
MLVSTMVLTPTSRTEFLRCYRKAYTAGRDIWGDRSNLHQKWP